MREMRTTLLISLLTALLLCAFALPAFTAPEAPAGPVEFKVPEGIKVTKSMSPFTHDNHKMDCVECHHKWDGASDVQPCSASGCHDQDGKKEATSFYKAFHDMKSKHSCLGCHRAEKKGPVSCNDCHPK